MITDNCFLFCIAALGEISALFVTAREKFHFKNIKRTPSMWIPGIVTNLDFFEIKTSIIIRPTTNYCTWLVKAHNEWSKAGPSFFLLITNVERFSRNTKTQAFLHKLIHEVTERPPVAMEKIRYYRRDFKSSIPAWTVESHYRRWSEASKKRQSETSERPGDEKKEDPHPLTPLSPQSYYRLYIKTQ